MNQSVQGKPWYRQFWPWFVIIIPLVSVLAGIAMIIISRHEPDSVIVDDYYKQGLAINKNFQREQVAKSLALSADVNINLSAQEITVLIPALDAHETPKLAVALSHPTHADRDNNLVLTASHDGEYIGKLNQITPGKWYVRIEPENRGWRISGELSLNQIGKYRLGTK